MPHTFILITVMLLVTSCGVKSIGRPYSTLGPTPLAQAELDEKLRVSPEIERFKEDVYTPRKNADEIELYHMVWTILNSPNAVPDWRNIYSTGVEGKPDQSYTKLARVLIYQKKLVDQDAFDQFKTKAANMGGDAVIDVYRKPLSTKEGTRHYDTYVGGVGMMTAGQYNRGAAWLYHGIVVRYNNSD